MIGPYSITWWKFTPDMTPFENDVSSPILESLYTGERLSLRDLPYGACYAVPRDADEGPNDWPPVGADGLSIVCVTPEIQKGKDGQDVLSKHHWYIDSRANNCTMPNDLVHRCWIRHGTVGDPLHVDKNGPTCAAGAGSIQTHGWHGYLQHGVLHE